MTVRRHKLCLGSVVLPLLFFGCDERVVLEDDAGAFTLQYDCSAFQPAARSTSEHALIRDYAIRAVSYAHKSGELEAVRPMMAADADGEKGELERLVVEYLCRGGELADPIRKKPRDGPSIAELKEKNRSLEVPLEIHSAAPEFRLPLLSPKYLAGDRTFESLREMRGQYVLINFWGSWCAPCLQEHEALMPLWERFRDRNLWVYGITVHRSRSILVGADGVKGDR